MLECIYIYILSRYVYASRQYSVQFCTWHNNFIIITANAKNKIFDVGDYGSNEKLGMKTNVIEMNARDIFLNSFTLFYLDIGTRAPAPRARVHIYVNARYYNSPLKTCTRLPRCSTENFCEQLFDSMYAHNVYGARVQLRFGRDCSTFTIMFV